jgi:hypothetical protein
LRMMSQTIIVHRFPVLGKPTYGELGFIKKECLEEPKEPAARNSTARCPVIPLYGGNEAPGWRFRNATVEVKAAKATNSLDCGRHQSGKNERR